MRAIFVLTALLAAVTTGSFAFAGDGSAGARAAGSVFMVSAGEVDSGDRSPNAGTSSIPASSSGTWHHSAACAVGGSALCRQFATCADGTPVVYWWMTNGTGDTVADYYQCPNEASPPAAAPPQITNALVLRALRRVELPGSRLQVQPPGGETLVNFKTNFFTDSGAFTRSVRLLGRRVDLRIRPAQFRWVFGDGADLASTSAGARYPDLEITHAYESKGSVSPSVDTTYAARYRVDGGAWRDVDGTVTIPGEPVRLRVRTARPVLVSHG